MVVAVGLRSPILGLSGPRGGAVLSYLGDYVGPTELCWPRLVS